MRAMRIFSSTAGEQTEKRNDIENERKKKKKESIIFLTGKSEKITNMQRLKGIGSICTAFSIRTGKPMQSSFFHAEWLPRNTLGKTPSARTSTARTPTARTPIARTPTARTPTTRTPTARTPTLSSPPGSVSAKGRSNANVTCSLR